jgi:hypothetical protein
MTKRTYFLLGSALLLVSAPAFSKKKEKPALPDVVLKAQTVLVLIQPDAAEPLTDPLANRKAQEEVEKALMRWGRFRLALDVDTADLVITVKKGTGKAANPTISGGPVDTRAGTIETTDNEIRIGGAKGRPPDATNPIDSTNSDSRARTGMEVGGTDDLFRVFLGGTKYPLDGPAIWTFTDKNALRPPDVLAVAQFRKAIEEAEKAAKNKQPPPPAAQPQPAKTP